MTQLFVASLFGRRIAWTASVLLGITLCLMASSARQLAASEEPEVKPTAEHQWLCKLVGEWDTKSTITIPEQPNVTFTGTQSISALGEIWIVAHGEMESTGMAMKNQFTLGYDPAQKKVVGTWIDTMTPYLWVYEGDLDAGKNLVHLHAHGPCPLRPGTISNFRDTIEITGPNEFIFSSAIEEKGKWIKFLTTTYTRKGS